MQSVGPNRGRRQIRRSQDALLARGIAVPARKFSGLSSPWIRPGETCTWRGGSSTAAAAPGALVTVLLSRRRCSLRILDRAAEDGLYGQTQRGARGSRHRRRLRRQAHHRRRPAARHRRRADRGAWRRPWHHDARLRHRRRQGAAREGAVGEACASHAASALDAPGRHRGARSLRRVADPAARPMWSMPRAP